MQNPMESYNHIYQSGYLDPEPAHNERFVDKVLSEIVHPTFADYYLKPVECFETVVISDIHLGSKVSRSEVLLDFLDRVRFKRLIINGDLFDSINMRRLNRYHWKVLGELRRLTDRESHVEIIWIRGNHDGYSDLLTQLLGISVYNEYHFQWQGVNVLTLHGDIFDSFTSRYLLLADWADYLYRFSILLDPVKMRFGRWLKRNSKTFIRNTIKVRKKAIKYARHKDAGLVICGHTHHAEDVNEKGIRYLNSGSWTDNPVHFIGFTGDEVAVVPFL